MSGGFAAPIETAVPPLTWLTTLSPQSRAQPRHHSRNATLTVAQLYITERFESEDRIDTTVICENIERTRFPVPFEEDHQESEDFPGLIRAADLIGQLGDPLYHRKIPPYSLSSRRPATQQNWATPWPRTSGKAISSSSGKS